MHPWTLCVIHKHLLHAHPLSPHQGSQQSTRCFSLDGRNGKLNRHQSHPSVLILKTCGCKIADGQPCSSLFSEDYINDTRAKCFFLSRDQLDMVLLGCVASNICVDDDVGIRSGHKPAKWQRTSIDYAHKGYNVCRDMFTFLHGVSHHKLHAIKDHFLEDGVTPREHGNTGKQPKHALSFTRILGILQFIQNYAEQHAILLPGWKVFPCKIIK